MVHVGLTAVAENSTILWPFLENDSNTCYLSKSECPVLLSAEAVAEFGSFNLLKKWGVAFFRCSKMDAVSDSLCFKHATCNMDVQYVACNESIEYDSLLEPITFVLHQVSILLRIIYSIYSWLMFYMIWPAWDWARFMQNVSLLVWWTSFLGAAATPCRRLEMRSMRDGWEDDFPQNMANRTKRTKQQVKTNNINNGLCIWLQYCTLGLISHRGHFLFVFLRAYGRPRFQPISPHVCGCPRSLGLGWPWGHAWNPVWLTFSPSSALPKQLTPWSRHGHVWEEDQRRWVGWVGVAFFYPYISHVFSKLLSRNWRAEMG